MKRKTNLDIWLLFIILLLVGMGTVMIYSTSAIYAQDKYGDNLFFLKRHLVWIVIGLGIMCLAWRADYHILRKYSRPLLLLVIILLIGTFIPRLGHRAGGASRWLRVGGFTFQPAEMAKLVLIIYLSDAFIRKQRWIQEFWRGMVPPLVAVGVVLGLVLLQPDLGTSIGIAMVVAVILFVAGARLRYLMIMGLSALPFLYVFIFSMPYRRARILSFFHPWDDPQGISFQIVQSFLALGSGGIFGVGLGQSRQKLLYLPAAHTDFIFSIIGEELGFLGTAFVVILFLGLIWCAVRIAMRSLDLFGHLLAIGIISNIAFQTIINIGVVTGSFPTKGLPLPFISFGGSAMVMNLLGMGIILSVHRSTVKRVASGSSMARDVINDRR